MLDLENLKASIVLKAMVTGLLKSKADPNFTVEMDSFGYVQDKLCYGCAATVTLVEMFGERRSASELMLGYVKPETYRFEIIPAFLSNILPNTQDSLFMLEIAVDSARLGDVSSLIELLTGEGNTSFDDRWALEDGNWEKCIPEIEATIAEMIAAGY